MPDKTDTQRDILIEWFHNKEKTNAEIADAVGCSESYVSQVKNKYDYDEIDAVVNGTEREIDDVVSSTEDEIDRVMDDW